MSISPSRDVDETPVKVTQRFEIAADNVATFAQRYPAAGGANVAIRLGVTNVRRGSTTWVDLGPDPDIYLARVNWLPDGKTIAIQRRKPRSAPSGPAVCGHRHG